MRYTDADLLSPEDALNLMAAVDAWCRRTGTNYLKLVNAARIPPSTRSSVKHGKRRLTVILAARITAAMTANPRGISKEEHKMNSRRPVRAARVMPVIVDRSPCPRCGTRKDFGCKHYPLTQENYHV